MIGDWETTANTRVQVRPVIVRSIDLQAKSDAVLPGQVRLLDTPGDVTLVREIEPSLAGYQLRVFFARNYGKLTCNTCGKRVRGFKANKEPCAHTCASRVPWIHPKDGDGPAWHEPQKSGEPILFATRQLAYVAGLELLGEETRAMRDYSWNGAAA